MRQDDWNPRAETTLGQFLQARRMETVNLLAGGVLHDFNNVLTAVMGHSAMLRHDAQLTPQNRQTAQDVLDAAHRASGLARQLLAYSRPHVRRPELLDLNTVIVDMSRLLKRILGEHADLRKKLAPDLPAVELDRSEIEQVIVNLVLNARDAMPGGGVLAIETARVETADGPRIELVIRDFGTGMDKDTLARAFEPFFTTRDQGQGVGLGLSTVKSAVAASGGEVRLESLPGEGTTCRLRFPPRVRPAAARTTSSPELDTHGGSETVMVVEDEAMVRATLVQVLRRFGYQVLEAGGGEEALRLAAGHPHPIDLLVTDVIMPRMSGKELAGRLLEMSPVTRVLFISGYSEDATVRDGLLGDEAELLPKPFTPEVLLRRLRTMLDVAAAEAET